MKTCKTTFFIILVLVLSQGVLSQQLVSVSATQLQPRKQAGYTFVIDMEQGLSVNASVHIDFPSEFSLENLKMAASSSFTGGLNVTVNNNTVEVQRTGLGETSEPGEIDIYVASIKNPSNMDNPFQFGITVLENNQEQTSSTFQQRILESSANQ